MVTNFDRVKRRSVIGLCCVKHEIKANIYIRGGMRNEARIKAIKYGNKTKTSKDVQNCKHVYMWYRDTGDRSTSDKKTCK